MFVNVCWTRNDKTLKSLLPVDKASKLLQELEKSGIKTWFELENIPKVN